MENWIKGTEKLFLAKRKYNYRPPSRLAGRDYQQKIYIALLMKQHESFTVVHRKGNKVVSKEYNFPYAKDEYIKSVLEVAKNMGIEMKEAIK